jgi:hypothetical protein
MLFQFRHSREAGIVIYAGECLALVESLAVAVEIPVVAFPEF